jgi:hypothetical protein
VVADVDERRRRSSASARTNPGRDEGRPACGRPSPVRLILASVKQREIDERVTLDDAGVIAVLNRMTKQRRDSIEQYRAAGREDLADQERFEIEVIASYLPPALDEAEVARQVDAAIAESGAASLRDMGAVSAAVKGRLHG